jgi:hypothetical protein
VPATTLIWELAEALEVVMTDIPGPRAIRLIFEVDGDEIRLIQQQPVDVAITGFDLPLEQGAGDFVEVRADDGRMISRVPLRAGMSSSVEVFPEDHSEPITRADLPGPRAFTVVVPAPPAADHVAVVRDSGRGVDALGVTATFPLERER